MKNNIFINRYVMACAIAIVITLVGIICMSTLPIEQYPNIAPPTVRVSTSYTGAGLRHREMCRFRSFLNREPTPTLPPSTFKTV